MADNGWSNQRHSSDRAGRTGRRGKDQPGRGDAVRRRRDRPPGIDRQRLQHRRFQPRSARARRLDRTQPLQFRLSRRSFRDCSTPRIGRLRRRRRARAGASPTWRSSSSIPTRRAPPLAAPALRALDELGIPHLIFVNRIDQAHGRIRDLLSALQPMSVSPLIARQIPIRDGEKVTGFVDLALERAFHYRAGQGQSSGSTSPPTSPTREAEARTQMLEQLADHDDELLEQLLMDEAPEPATDLRRSGARDRREPRRVGAVRLGAAARWGVRRLLKALRHEAPGPARGRPAAWRSSDPALLRLQDHPRRLGRPAGAGARARRQRSPKASDLKTADGGTARARRAVPGPGRKDREDRRGRATAMSSRSPRSTRSRPANGSARAALPPPIEVELPGAQLRARDRARRPQGRRQAVGRARSGCSRRTAR